VKQNIPKSFAEVAASTPTYRCPECDQPLFRRQAKKGSGFFWGCSGYPECETTLPDNQGSPGESRKEQKKTGKCCPECGKGELVERLTKNGKNQGKTFLGCNQYPECKFTEYSS
jgi:ssDNA-binding Zn-finger/Zn-ribbon topoisomerase 1